ncbi:MAG: fimbria/pilus periplasmic chaperone [Rhodospirillales bacterium]|nr:fimbria/pilus periplasmic chaperone [Rhodospirillales bacterium]
MQARPLLIALILLGVLVLLPPRSVEAGQLKVSPIRLDLRAEEPISTVTVSNSADEPVLLHLSVQAWDHTTGNDRYLDTRDLLLNPMIFELGPGQQQLVRIGLARPLSNERERAYRLFIREVPQQAHQKTRQITTVLNLSLPVFVAPEQADAPLLIWRLEQTSATRLALQVENRGNLHAVVSTIALQRQSGESLASIDRRFYVLPGQARRWDVPGSLAGPDESVTLTASSRRGPLQAALSLGVSTTVEEALR